MLLCSLWCSLCICIVLYTAVYFLFQAQKLGKVRKRCSCNFLSHRDSVKMCRLRLWVKLFFVQCSMFLACECGRLETHCFLECRKYRTERSIFFVKLAGLGVKAFSVLSLFGHSDDEHSVLAWHRTV